MPFVKTQPLAAALPISEANVTNLVTDLATLTTLASTLHTASVPISTAQIIAMNPAGQVTLVAAQGANKLIVPYACQVNYVPGNTLFDASPTYRIGLGASGNADNYMRLFFTSNIALDSAATPYLCMCDPTTSNNDFTAAMTNLPLTIASSIAVR